MNQKKIILIEDELFISDLYKRMLEKAGYNVLTAVDGEEGLATIRANTDAALVLLDVMLPKMHGVDVLKIIKADKKTEHMQVVLLSNLGDDGVIQEAIQQGARDYLRKVNIVPQELVVVVEKYLSNPKYIYKNEA